MAPQVLDRQELALAIQRDAAAHPGATDQEAMANAVFVVAEHLARNAESAIAELRSRVARLEASRS